jgi:hypothetical protein
MSGTLRLRRGSLQHDETAQTRRRHGDDDFNLLDVDLAFAAMLGCSHCEEAISCCGVGGYAQEERQDDEGDWIVDYEVFFPPMYFSRAMKIFQPPHRTPGSVKECLFRSFNVFFCDVSAAGNHVRQCAEEILAHAGIAPKGAKGRFLSLEKRIESYKAIDPENAERVSALRWIGNFGSHPERLTKDDLFDAYDILDVLLEDLYVGHQKSVRARVEKINQARSPGK